MTNKGRPKKPAKQKTISRGVSATPTWWAEADEFAESLGLPTSTMIRIAVDYYRRQMQERGDDPALRL